MELLKAEAALRGWISGNPETHYENAVRASMEIETLYPGGMSVSEAEINQYFADNPYSWLVILRSK